MKTVTRYEVRWGGTLIKETDNICVAWETKDKYEVYGRPITIHEITTTERDITDNARIDNSKKD